MTKYEQKLLDAIDEWVNNPQPTLSARESITSLRNAAHEAGQEGNLEEFFACVGMLQS